MVTQCSYEFVASVWQLKHQSLPKTDEILWVFSDKVRLEFCNRQTYLQKIHLLKSGFIWNFPEGVFLLYSASQRHENSPIGNILTDKENGIYKQMHSLRPEEDQISDPNFGRNAFHSINGQQSSLSEKTTAIAQYIRSLIKQKEYYTFSKGAKSVRLIQTSNDTVMLVQVNQEKQTASIYFANGDVHEIISRFSKRYFKINTSKIFSSKKPEKIWSLGKEIQLFKFNNYLFWHQYDKKEKHIRLIDFCSSQGPGLNNENITNLEEVFQRLPKLYKKLRGLYSWVAISHDLWNLSDPVNRGREIFHSNNNRREAFLGSYVKERKEKKIWKSKKTLTHLLITRTICLIIDSISNNFVLELTDLSNLIKTWIKISIIQSNEVDKSTLSGKKITNIFSDQGKEEFVLNLIKEVIAQRVLFNEEGDPREKFALWTYKDYQEKFTYFIIEFGGKLEQVVCSRGIQRASRLALASENIPGIKKTFSLIRPVVNNGVLKPVPFQGSCSWAPRDGLVVSAFAFSVVNRTCRLGAIDSTHRVSVFHKAKTCTPYTSSQLTIIERIRDLNQRILFAQNFTPRFIKRTTNPDSCISASIDIFKYKYFKEFTLEKISSSSLLDETMQIDHLNWVVTLSANNLGESSRCNPPGPFVRTVTNWFGHAQITIEGIKHGRKFFYRIHLVDDKNGKKGLELANEIVPENIQEKISWKLPNKKLQSLVEKYEQIKQKKMNEEKSITNEDFSSFLIFPNGDKINCIGWAVGLLKKCGIDTPNYGEDKSALSPFDYIKLAHKLKS